MHVVMVGNFGLGYKGTMAARAIPIAHEIVRRGHMVTVIVPSDRDPVERHSRSAPDGPRIITVGPLPATLPGHLGAAARIVHAVLRARPDVLYAFKPKGYAGLALWLFWTLRRRGLTRAVLALDTDDWEGAGGWLDKEPSPWWQRRLIAWQEQWCLSHADIVTAASRELASRVRAVRQAAEGVVYAPNAVSPASPGWRRGDGAPIRTALGLAERPIVLVYTRFVEFQPVRLLTVFEMVLQSRPEVCLLVVGAGLHGEERVFARLARERGLAGAVRQVGWVKTGELPGFFAAADIALYPLDDTLLNRAKCPMKLVDLLAAGVPVVADAVGQAREYIADGRTGLLVPPGDSIAMARRALALLENPSWRHEISAAARSSMRERWTWERLAPAIIRALEGAVGARS
ncbi:MAG TPA: glycosyltransferase family 4 protein [Chloroflexota bacterium]|nr:glycosyltransferase family 4 protein [Chloroflexota bacterium]